MKKSRFFKESKLRKYKDKASDLVDKGKYKKALSIYRDILAAFPSDTAIMLKIGDLCKKLEMKQEAVAVYVAAAEHHAQSGRLLQAIAVCRLILEIDNTHSQTQKKLAAWYAQKYGSSEHSGVVNLNTKKVTRIGTEKSAAPMAEPVAATPVATADEIIDLSENDLIEEGVVRSTERTTKDSQTLSQPVNDADTETYEIDELDDTAPLRFDFSGIQTADTENSTVYDISDIEEYKAELEAEGLLESGADLSEVDETQETRLSGIVTSENIVLKISKPPAAVETLPPIPLFSGLDELALLDLINELPLRHFDALETVVKEGEHGDSFFIISSGSVEIFKNDESIATLEEGAFFGEMAMLFPGPRQASVVTVEPCEMFEVTNTQLEELKERHPIVGQVLLDFAEQRLLANLLNTSPIFAPFGEADRQSLIDKFEPYLLEQGAVAIKQGSQTSGLYLIVAGSVSVTMTATNGDVIDVSTLKANDIFGEVSLLTRQGAIATVTALTECRVLMLPKVRFDELIMTHPQVLELVSSISEERVAALNELKSRLSTNHGSTLL